MSNNTEVIKQKFSFIIYGIAWLSPNHCIIGGGGGHGIPNKLITCKFTGQQFDSICEIDTRDDVVWHISVCLKQKLIAFTSLHKLHFASYDQQYNITLGTSVGLFSNKSDLGKKMVAITEKPIPVKKSTNDEDLKSEEFATVAAVCDDNCNILIYEIKDINNVKLINTLVGHKKYITDLSFKNSDKYVREYEKVYSLKLCSCAEDGTLKVWDVIEGKTILDVNVPFQISNQYFRACRFGNGANCVYAMHTARKSPTYISKYQLPSGTKVFTSKAYSKPCTAFNISRTEEGAHCTSEFLGFGVADGVLITDTTLKQYSFNAPLHEFPVSTLDMIVHDVEDQPEPVVSILSGSIDKTVVHHTVSTKYRNTLRWFYITLAILLILFLITAYWTRR